MQENCIHRIQYINQFQNNKTSRQDFVKRIAFQHQPIYSRCSKIRVQTFFLNKMKKKLKLVHSPKLWMLVKIKNNNINMNHFRGVSQFISLWCRYLFYLTLNKLGRIPASVDCWTMFERKHR